MLSQWVLTKIEPLLDHHKILIRDSLRLLPEIDGEIHQFAKKNGFLVIPFSTNLAFREIYEQVGTLPEVKKIIFIDRAPMRRRLQPAQDRAPAPFYPDLFEQIAPEARIDLDLRQFLIEKTGDPSWPKMVNESQFARLITKNLEAALQAHRNLRNADKSRFTDYDFQTIAAYAALGVADCAFKQFDYKIYWRIGLLRHEILKELDRLVPEITKPIYLELNQAPVPFRWLKDHDPEPVIHACYLAAILDQHFEHGSLLIARLHPTLAALGDIQSEILNQALPELIEMDAAKAFTDIEQVENELDATALHYLIVDQFKLTEPGNFVSIIQKERYSTLIRGLALLFGLEDALSDKPDFTHHERLEHIFQQQKTVKPPAIADRRSNESWRQLKEAYELALTLQRLRRELTTTLKILKVIKTEQLSFRQFQNLWNEKKLNRLEYYLSLLERLVTNSRLLPRAENELPSICSNLLHQIRVRTRALSTEIHTQLDELNLCFQQFIEIRYPEWVKADSEVWLTSHFLRRCLKAHWDPQKEKAVLLIFDGMRYDIWDEFLRPLLEERMELIQEYPAASLLPSETELTRKAISAGDFPDAFESQKSENKLLKEGLQRELNYRTEVEPVAPETQGTAETVRYRAGNLDVYIFDLCDKELHGNSLKTLSDQRQVPSRPLAFIYQQHIKNIIDVEVLAIVRKLRANTRVFITADHGFTRNGSTPLFFEPEDLNELADCTYRNTWLRHSVYESAAPAKVKQNVIAFTPAQLRVPASATIQKRTGQLLQKEFKTIVFPKPGFSFNRKGTHFKPDAYSHGGISIQELLIPMIVLRVREKDETLLILDDILGPAEIIEGQEVEFCLPVRPRTVLKAEIRLEVTGEIRGLMHVENSEALNEQTLFISTREIRINYRLKPDCATAGEAERKEGILKRRLILTIGYWDGKKQVTKSRMREFNIQLNSERIVRRVPTSLGNILGLTPKSMR